MPRCVLQAIPLGQRKLQYGYSLLLYGIDQCLASEEQQSCPAECYSPKNTDTDLQSGSGAKAAAIPLSHSHAGDELGFPLGNFPKFRFLKALLMTPQDSLDNVADVCGVYKMEHLFTNHHHSGDL